jgi:hypothetical protein
MQLFTFLIVAQDARSGTDAPANLIVLALTVIGAVLQFGKEIVGFLQTRVRQPTPSQPAFRVVDLRMSRRTPSVAVAQKRYRESLALTTPTSALVAVLFLASYLLGGCCSVSDSSLIR